MVRCLGDTVFSKPSKEYVHRPRGRRELCVLQERKAVQCIWMERWSPEWRRGAKLRKEGAHMEISLVGLFISCSLTLSTWPIRKWRQFRDFSSSAPSSPGSWGEMPVDHAGLDPCSFGIHFKTTVSIRAVVSHFFDLQNELLWKVSPN